jgi:hypothetical protein
MCIGDTLHRCMCARNSVSPVHTTSLRAYFLYRPVTGQTVEMFPLLKSVFSCRPLAVKGVALQM